LLLEKAILTVEENCGVARLMSKRAAQFQGRKGTGFEVEMSVNPDDIPKKATAAQLANRK
jgi:hypothetical protein